MTQGEGEKAELSTWLLFQSLQSGTGREWSLGLFQMLCLYLRKPGAGDGMGKSGPGKCTSHQAQFCPLFARSLG